MGMFGNNSTVVTTFAAKDNMSPVVRGIRRTMDDFKRDAKTGFGLAAGISVFGLATQGLGMVADGLIGVTKAAAEDEKSLARLNTTLRANVENWGSYGDVLDKATEDALALAFADDEVRASLNQLIPRTKDVTEAIRLNALAMDLARFKGMGLEDAASLVGKAFSGQVTALRRAGIAIDANADSTRALAQLQEQVSGQALAYSQTAEGSYKTLELTLEELGETIGYELLPHLKSFAGYLRTDVIPNIDEYVHSLQDAVRWVSLLAATARMDLAGALKEVHGLMDEEMRTLAVPAPGTINFFDPIPQAARDATEEGMRSMRRFSFAAPKLMGTAVVDMKNEVKNGKAAIIEQFRDLAWQSKHPFAEVNYANWLKRKEAKALRLMKQANDRDMPGLAAQHAQLAADIRAEYQGLPGYMASIAGQAMSALSIIPGFGWVDDGFNMTLPNNEPKKPKKKPKKNKPGPRPGDGPPTGQRAVGGPVSAGGTYLVGENGPELLHMGSSNGNISNRGGSGPINVYVDGQRLFTVMNGRLGRAIAMGG